MDREDLDRDLQKKGSEMQMQNPVGTYTKKWLAAAAAALLIVGFAGGCTLHDLPFMKSPGTESNYKMPESSAGENFDLPAIRNTSVVEAVKKVGPAVVGITTQIYDRDVFNRRIEVGQSVGSGVIFDKKGYIVTNNHVVGDSEKVNVCLSNGDTVQGTVVGTDPSTDLAVVKIEGRDDLPVAEFGDSDHLQIGETAIAIGNPLGLEFQGTVTVGVISALNRTLDDMDQRFKLIQTDAAINPGNSGGALVTADGRVVGINSAKIAKEGVEGMGFAIPINQARTVIEELIQNGHVTRAYLGLYGADKDIAARYGYRWDSSVKGVLVMRVAENSPLALAGIRPGDYITAVGDTSIESVRDIRDVLDQYKPGDTLSITYVHNGQSRRTEILLSEAPQD